MIGKTNSGSGASGAPFGYNFNVVKYTSTPSGTANENTIGIVTTVNISDYIISPDAPSNPTAGLVWIRTANSSPISIFIDSNKKVKVYLQSVQQYISNKWVNKDTYIYMNNEWKSLITYYFASGSGALIDFEHSAYDWGRVTIGTDAIHIEYLDAPGGSDECGAISSGTIDVTDISTVYFKVKVIQGSLRVGLDKNAIDPWNAPSISTPEPIDNSSSDPVTVSIDVSAYGGNYYIICYMNHHGPKESYIYDIYAI